MNHDLDSLRPYYRIKQHGDSYHIYCKVCGRGWTLPVVNVSVGNILRLLDHGRSHKKQ